MGRLDMAGIHPTAIVEPGAVIDRTADVGAYAYIGGRVEIGAGCRIHHHATVDGLTVMGTENEVFPYAFIGGKTHDMKYCGGETGLIVGNGNTFREYSTVHVATSDGDFTRVGDKNLVLAYSHIAHDCQVGNHLIMSSHAALGGHVVVEDHVNIGWGAGVHQFCRLGRHGMLAAMSKQVHDLMPYMISDGNPAAIRMVNKVGLERQGITAETIGEIQHWYRIVFRDGLNRSQALEKLREIGADSPSPHLHAMIAFIAESKRGVA